MSRSTLPAGSGQQSSRPYTLKSPSEPSGTEPTNRRSNGRPVIDGALIPPDDPRWRDFLSRTPHDVYHMPEYADIAAQPEHASAAAIYVQADRGEALFPLIVRPIPDRLGDGLPLLDATSPYGYASPLIRAESDTHAVRVVGRAIEIAAQNSLVSLFLRLHPLLPTNMAALAAHGCLRWEGPTVTLDTACEDSESWRQVRSDHKSDINRLVGTGYETLIDEWRLYPAFIDMYHETMQRVGAAEYYFFDRTYFEALRTQLRQQIHLFVVIAPNGDPAAGGLFFSHNGIVGYHLSGTADRYLTDAPTKLMLNAAREWSLVSGMKAIHLGGGVGGSMDSLFKFKSGFSRSWSPYRSVRIVVNPDAYQVLAASIPRARAWDNDYFPTYRTPTSDPAEPL